jgi:hypothetical protein
MTQSQPPGLDTLAEGSQYALEKLQLARQAEIPYSKSASSDSRSDLAAFKLPGRRDSISDARTNIRKNSASASVRRRISRACDQCNQLRTKCDGQTPCAHCTGQLLLVFNTIKRVRLANWTIQSLACPANTPASERNVGKRQKKISPRLRRNLLL